MADTHYPCGHENKGCAKCYTQDLEAQLAALREEAINLGTLFDRRHDSLTALRKKVEPFVAEFRKAPEFKADWPDSWPGHLTSDLTIGQQRALAEEVEPALSEAEGPVEGGK